MNSGKTKQKISNNSLLLINLKKFSNLSIFCNSDKTRSLERFLIPFNCNLIALTVVCSTEELYCIENLKNLIILKKSSSILVCGSPINLITLLLRSLIPC